MAITNYNRANFRKSTTYTKTWRIENFHCPAVTSPEKLPAEQIDVTFPKNVKFMGQLSLMGSTCQNRICKLTLDCVNREQWEVFVELKIDEKGAGQRLRLNQSNKTNLFKLSSAKGCGEHECRLDKANYIINLRLIYAEYNIQPLEVLI